MGCGSSNNQTCEPKQQDAINYSNFILQHKKRSYKEDYLIGKLLGEGAFGQVYICKHKKNGEIRVLKKMSKEGLTEEELKKNMVTDVMVLQRLAHPSIIKTYEFYQDDYMFYIVSEYCEGGALLDRVVAADMLSEKEAASVLKQVLEAINYSHQQGVMHRDLKLENIVLDEKAKNGDITYPIKVIDYGCSTYFSKDQTFSDLCGTPIYIAPEVIKGKYNEKCDIWSIGVLMYILLSGYPPFSGDGMDDLFENIKSGNFNFDNSTFDSVSDEAKQLIKMMMTIDYSDRPSAEEVLRSPWFKNAKEEKLPNEQKQQALKNLKNFQAKSNLQSAILSYIATQLVTKAEQKNMQIAFKEIDTNGNGSLSKSEIHQYFEQFLMGDELNEHVDQIMEKLDENNSGSVNYNEFITASLDFDKVTSDKNLQNAFEFFDQDKNGQISPEEIKKVLGKDVQQQQFGQELIKQLSNYDKDGDKKLNFEEFKDMMRNMSQ